ncbi:MAG: iron chelate uptake ABC transporter family permease subunit [Spirochaetaceae bacterium]|jgi:iron complex transport system permease protein|nr:iron chelate uptake ABC transporter family permease subunit [Spirochaetaceae bacterium]
MHGIAANRKKSGILVMLIFSAAVSALAYLFVKINAGIFDYALYIRAPKLAVMLLTAFCIGSASIVFQTLINNTIVTPCLLGMNALYVLIHTLTVFLLGSASILITTRALSFSIDLIIMGFAATLIYGTLFKKTGSNVLYIVLAGTVMATLFTSLATTLQRVMDPNEYETLQGALIASFSKVNANILGFACVAVVCIIIVLRKDLMLLNVIALGKNMAVNLGVDYDRTVQRLLLGVTLFIAIATAMVGPISFLGLIIANLARELLKTFLHRYLIFGCVFIGMIVLLVGQTVIERLLGYSTTIGVFINSAGGIYFLFLLMRNRGR